MDSTTLEINFDGYFRRLDVSCCRLLSDEGFAKLTTLSSLRSLDMSYLDAIKDDSLRSLQQLQNLTYLLAKGCPQLTSDGKIVLSFSGDVGS